MFFGCNIFLKTFHGHSYSKFFNKLYFSTFFCKGLYQTKNKTDFFWTSFERLFNVFWMSFERFKDCFFSLLFSVKRYHIDTNFVHFKNENKVIKIIESNTILWSNILSVLKVQAPHFIYFLFLFSIFLLLLLFFF